MKVNMAGPNPEMILTMDDIVRLIKANSDFARAVLGHKLTNMSFRKEDVTLEETSQGYKLLHLPVNPYNL
ncbi:MAG: hypothetical protein NUV61_01345 [Candidatus Azambacteria bacterium]|nr:hypothetical protein [Candidatus Azambacteria bacterium]